MYTAREKDYCAGLNCAMKDGNKFRNILNLQTQVSQHMTGYTKEMVYFNLEISFLSDVDVLERVNRGSN